jgi:hypothetical protein
METNPFYFMNNRCSLCVCSVQFIRITFKGMIFVSLFFALSSLPMVDTASDGQGNLYVQNETVMTLLKQDRNGDRD